MGRFAQQTILVTGSRAWNNRSLLFEVFDMLPRTTRIVHGNAKGLDLAVASVCQELGWPSELIWGYKAPWHGFRVPGRRNIAGPLRNQVMEEREEPDKVYAFHERLWETSRGTKHMVELALSKGTPVYWFRESDTEVRLLTVADIPKPRRSRLTWDGELLEEARRMIVPVQVADWSEA